MPTIKAKITRSFSRLQQGHRFFRRPVHYSVIGTQELIRLAAQDSQLSISVVSQIFDGIRVQFNELLLNGHTVQLGDLGSFRMSISCKAVENVEDISTDLLKTRRIIFLPSKELKTAIESATIKSELSTFIESLSIKVPTEVGTLQNEIITFNKRVNRQQVVEKLKIFIVTPTGQIPCVVNADGTIFFKDQRIFSYTLPPENPKQVVISDPTTFMDETVARISWQ